jgi:hypothetical protein
VIDIPEGDRCLHASSAAAAFSSGVLFQWLFMFMGFLFCSDILTFRVLFYFRQFGVDPFPDRQKRKPLGYRPAARSARRPIGTFVGFFRWFDVESGLFASARTVERRLEIPVIKGDANIRGFRWFHFTNTAFVSIFWQCEANRRAQ